MHNFIIIIYNFINQKIKLMYLYINLHTHTYNTRARAHCFKKKFKNFLKIVGSLKFIIVYTICNL